MLLDTLPFLEKAIHLYKNFGFYKIEFMIIQFTKIGILKIKNS